MRVVAFDKTGTLTRGQPVVGGVVAAGTDPVADIVRYIGKGKGLRLYSHMKEVRTRLNRDYRLQNIGPRLQQNLTNTNLHGP